MTRIVGTADLHPPGLCHCGCGQPTRIAYRNHALRGWTKGEPMPFLFGHNSRRGKCKRGHDLRADGYVDPMGHRRCQPCQAEAGRRRRDRIRAGWSELEDGLKVCAACGDTKPTSSFFRSSQHKDGRQSRCIRCYRAAVRTANGRATRRYRDAHRDRLRTARSAWQRRNSAKRSLQKNERNFGGHYLFVLRRDLARCVDCHATLGLVIHHLDGRSYHNSDDPNNDPANLVTLCRSCHSKRHVVELGRPHERVPGQSRRLAS